MLTGATGIRRPKSVIRDLWAACLSALAPVIVGSWAACGQGWPPSVTIQPPSQSITVGHRATFSADAWGASPLSFQWRLGTNIIPEANTYYYVIDNVQPTSAGTYSVIVTNAFGSASASAELIVTPPGATDSWTPVNSGSSNDLLSVAGSPGTIVAVGVSGAVVTSTNGMDWSQQFSGVTSNLHKIVYGNGRFVAIGEDGLIITSADGVRWDSQDSGPGNWIADLAFGNGLFVAVGTPALVQTSGDGIHWTTQKSGITNDIGWITFGNGRFMAVDGLECAITSTNGTDWTPEIPIAPGRPYITAITFGNGNFLVIGLVNNMTFPSYWYSPDGVNWTDTILFNNKDLTDKYLTYAAAFGNGNFVLVAAFSFGGAPDPVPDFPGISSIFSAATLKSESSVLPPQSWILRQQFSKNLYGVGFWRDRFFAVGEAGEIVVSGIAPPVLSNVVVGTNGTSVELQGTPFQSYVLQASPTVTGDWQPISTNTIASDGTVIFTDPVSSAGPSRFYRVLSQ